MILILIFAVLFMFKRCPTPCLLHSTRFESLVLSDRTLDKYQANGLKMLEPGASMFLTSVYPNAGFATVFTVATIETTLPANIGP